jgi:hypothetical protein
LASAVADGVAKLTWDTETFAYAEAHDGNRWVGLVAAQQVLPRGSGYIVAGLAAKQQMDSEAKPRDGDGTDSTSSGGPGSSQGTAGSADETSNDAGSSPSSAGHLLPMGFYGKFSLDSVRAIRQLEDILQNVVEHLSRADGGSVDLTLEINARSAGFDDRVQRVVNENAGQLGATGHEFE